MKVLLLGRGIRPPRWPEVAQERGRGPHVASQENQDGRGLTDELLRDMTLPLTSPRRTQ